MYVLNHISSLQKSLWQLWQAHEYMHVSLHQYKDLMKSQTWSYAKYNISLISSTVFTIFPFFFC